MTHNNKNRKLKDSKFVTIRIERETLKNLKLVAGGKKSLLSPDDTINILLGLVFPERFPWSLTKPNRKQPQGENASMGAV